MASRSTRLGVLTIVVAVGIVGGFFAIRALYRAANNQLAADRCTIGTFDIDPAQAAVAATMVGAVSKYRQPLPERAAVLVIAAGLQESKLRNLPPGAGDRDSVGVLQQRPSQGWGGPAAKKDPTKLNNVFSATTEFLDHLVAVTGWQKLPLADAVQDVQVSADGAAYAQHEAEAQALADALQGHQPAGINCSFAKPTNVAPVATVARDVQADLPIHRPTTSGLTVRVVGAAWQTVAWFVANADRLGIDEVAYKGKRWTRSSGWKSVPTVGSSVIATMYHA